MSFRQIRVYVSFCFYFVYIRDGMGLYGSWFIKIFEYGFFDDNILYDLFECICVYMCDLFYYQFYGFVYLFNIFENYNFK